jgi:hypothetical protein
MSTRKILGATLALQVVLAAATWWPSSTAPTASSLLVEGGANAITTLAVTPGGDDGETVSMTATDGTWQITSEQGYPADPEKLGEVLDLLGEITLRTPVATQASSHDKLNVSESSFGKKVELTADGETKTLYLGAATSKSVYLRLEGSDDVYKAKGFSEWGIKDTARSYWPNDAVSFDAASVTQLTVTTPEGALAFTKSDDAWSLKDAPEGVTADTAAVGELVDTVSTVRLAEPIGKVTEAAFGLDRGIHITWTTDIEGVVWNNGITLGAEVDSNFYAQVDDSEFVVKVPGYKVKDLVGMSLEGLTMTAGAMPAVPLDQ